MGDAASAADSGDISVSESQSFAFEHKVFNAEGGFFSYSRRTKDVYFNLRIGDMDAKVNIDTLCNELQLDEESEDIRLLGVLRKGIVYVDIIRPGDKIPSELLDGSASWSIDDRHRDAAKLKLTAATLDWIDGGAGGTVAARVDAMNEDEEAQKKVNEAFQKIAEELKLGDKQKVVDRFEALANELGYVEALRDYFKDVQQIQRSLKMLQSIYGSDLQMADDINRMSILMQGPVKDMTNAFQEVDAHTEDIKSAIRNFDGEVEYLRGVRDRLHIESLLWTETLAAWKDKAPEQSAEIEALLKETYRFLAQNFSVSRQWGR